MATCLADGDLHLGTGRHAWSELVVCLRFGAAVAAVARDRVANVLLAYKGKNHLGGAARAAEDIARQTARDLLGPLLDAAVSRLGFVLRKALDIAADKAMRQGELGLGRKRHPQIACFRSLVGMPGDFAVYYKAASLQLLQEAGSLLQPKSAS